MKNRLIRYSSLLFFTFCAALVSCAGQERQCFAVYSDTHSAHASAAHQKLAEAVRVKQPAAVFIVGDLVDDGNNPTDWQAFNRIENPLRGQSELFTLLGNHENFSALYFANFGLPAWLRWREVVRAPLRFLLLDSTSPLNPGSRQYRWLESALENKPAGVEFTVVMLHHPVLSSGMHGEDEALKSALMPLLEKYAVALVISGHEHSYERSFCRGVYYLVGGGAGGALRDKQRRNPYSQLFIKSHSFSRLCAGKGALSVDTFDENGKQIDGFTIPARRKLIVFHSLSCQACLKAKKELIPEIEKRFSGVIEIEYRDLNSVEDYKFLLALQEKYKRDFELTLPVFYMEGDFLNGKALTREALLRFIAAGLARSRAGGSLPAVDLTSRFRGFQPLAVAAAGLIDGINPCAFTVIVFFVSFLALQGYRRREVMAIGLSFICAVFLTYLLLGLGAFNFLYSLRGFWQTAKAMNIAIGWLCLLLGSFSLYDFWKIARGSPVEGLLLQLPQPIKNRIHQVIGRYYRLPRRQAGLPKDNVGPDRRSVAGLMLTALATGFLVSLLEAACTGQVYLPTIVFVLKVSSLKLQALGYLLLYNLLFILPLFIIFACALRGAASEQFGRFFKKHLGLVKALMALVFFAMGLFLLKRA